MKPKPHYYHKGQGLIEYLILVCLIGVTAISVVTLVSQNLRARYANISNALKGKNGSVKLDEVRQDHYKSKGFDRFQENSPKR